MQDCPDSSPVRVTFSSSFRNRSIWKVMGPVLTASTARIEESDLQGFDFEFHPQQLKVLLLAPSSLEPLNRTESLSRLERFNTLAPRGNAIAFLLSEEPFNSASGKCSLDRLMALQVLITESLSTPFPIIPIPDSSCFMSCIQEYMGSLVNIPVFSPCLTDSVSLLSHMRSTYSNPLSEQVTNILSDLFPSMRSLSQAVRTQEGRVLLSDYFGDVLAREIIGFWDGDQVCD